MIRRFWHLLKYLRAPHVHTRAELDSALASPPRYIIIKGSEALRAYAASLAYRGGQEAAALEEAQAEAAMPTYMIVPTVGRIRDGYRQRPAPNRRRRSGKRTDRARIQAGLGTIIAASIGLFALLGAEWLMWPSNNPELVRGPHHEAVPVRRGVVLPLPTHAPPPPPLTLEQQTIRLMIPVLILLALGALVFLAWQAIGPGRPVRVSWRVDYRVQGQLVLARIRTKIA